MFCRLLNKMYVCILTQLSFQSDRLLFWRASAEVRGENTPERKLASTGYQTYNYQVMSLTRSPLSHPGGDDRQTDKGTKSIDRKRNGKTGRQRNGPN